MLRVLVTRPRADSEALVEELAARGHAALVEPLLSIRVRSDAAVDLDGVQALLFTSANGVRSFAELSERRDLPAFAVGEASAAAARAAGFAAVESAGGDARDLARLVRARLDPAAGALFHAAGTVTAGDLQADLAADGFDVRRVPLYEAVPSEALSDQARTALLHGRLDAALFFSPRTAGIFVTLVRETGLAAACSGVVAVCLSEAVADQLATLTWRGVRVAERPERRALLAALDRPAMADSTSAHPTSAEGGAAGAEQETMSQDSDDTQPQGSTSGPESQTGGAHGDGNPAQQVITRFGGIRPMAHKLGVAVSTVQGWKNRGVIPENRHDEILEAAQQHGVDVDRALLRASAEPEAQEVAAAEPAEAGTHAAGAEAEAAAAAESAREHESAEHAVGAEAAAATAAEGSTRPSGSWSEPPTRQPEPAPQPSGGGWLPGMLLGAAILVAGLAAAVVTREEWQPYLGAPAAEETAVEAPSAQAVAELQSRLDGLQGVQDTVADLSGQLAEVEDRLAAVAEQAGSGGAARQRVADLESRVAKLADSVDSATGRLDQATSRMETAAGRIDQLASRVENLSGRLEELAAGTASAEALQSLIDRVGGLEQQVAGLQDLEQRITARDDIKATARAAAAREVAQALAVAELRDALRFAGPFEAELKAVRQVIPGDSALAQQLDTLAPYAASGVATRQQLRDRFDAAARKAVAATAGGNGGSWMDGVLQRLNDVITVRPVGQDAEGDAPGAVLARAEAKLDDGDLAAAAATLDQLDGPAAEAMQSWRQAARARLAAEKALAGLSAKLADTLAKTGGGA